MTQTAIAAAVSSASPNRRLAPAAAVARKRKPKKCSANARGAPNGKALRDSNCSVNGHRDDTRSQRERVNRLYADIEALVEGGGVETALVNAHRDEPCEIAGPIGVEHRRQPESGDGRGEKEHRRAHQIQLKRRQIALPASRQVFARQQSGDEERAQRVEVLNLTRKRSDLIGQVVKKAPRREVSPADALLSACRAVSPRQLRRAVRTSRHYQISLAASWTTRPGPAPVMRPNVLDEMFVTGLLKFT